MELCRARAQPFNKYSEGRPLWERVTGSGSTTMMARSVLAMASAKDSSNGLITRARVVRVKVQEGGTAGGMDFEPATITFPPGANGKPIKAYRLLPKGYVQGDSGTLIAEMSPAPGRQGTKLPACIA